MWKKFPVEFSMLRLVFEPGNAFTTSYDFLYLLLFVCIHLVYSVCLCLLMSILEMHVYQKIAIW